MSSVTMNAIQNKSDETYITWKLTSFILLVFGFNPLHPKISMHILYTVL